MSHPPATRSRTANQRTASARTPPAEAARALREMLQDNRADTEALFDAVATLTSTLNLSKLLGYVVELCAKLTGCAGSLVYLWEEDRQRLVVRAAVEGYEQWVNRYSLALGEGLTGWTALTRQPGIIKENANADPRFKFVPELNDDRFQSYLHDPDRLAVGPAPRGDHDAHRRAARVRRRRPDAGEHPVGADRGGDRERAAVRAPGAAGAGAAFARRGEPRGRAHVVAPAHPVPARVDRRWAGRSGLLRDPDAR